MRILVANDDGISSEGVKALAEVLSKDNEIIVVAPDGNRSGFSHSLTIGKELFFKEVKISDKFKAFSLSGTPADCVKFATHKFSDFKFDLVCSGINHGNNLGSDTAYSGTVAAGLEANYLGLPAIAFSNIAQNGWMFDETAKIVDKLFKKLVELSSTEYTVNVNIPNLRCEEIKGVKFAHLGVQKYSDYYEQTSGGGYVLKGEMLTDGVHPECDVALSVTGYVTVTPISFNRTDFATIKKFEGTELKL